MISDRERKKSSQYLSSKNGLGPRKNILQEHEGVRFLEQEAYHGAPKTWASHTGGTARHIWQGTQTRITRAARTTAKT